MMFNDFWARLVASNPDLTDPDTVMRIPVASFKRSMRQSFEMGQASGAVASDPTKQTDTASSIFEDIFGRKP